MKIAIKTRLDPERTEYRAPSGEIISNVYRTSPFNPPFGLYVGGTRQHNVDNERYLTFCSSQAVAEAHTEMVLKGDGYAIYVPLEASTAVAAPAPNSIEITITRVASEGYYLNLTGCTDVDSCDRDKRIARIGKATLTFHGN